MTIVCFNKKINNKKMTINVLMCHRVWLHVLCGTRSNLARNDLFVEKKLFYEYRISKKTKKMNRKKTHMECEQIYSYLPRTTRARAHIHITQMKLSSTTKNIFRIVKVKAKTNFTRYQYCTQHTGKFT